MSTQVLYAYVSGSDLDDIAERLLDEFDSFERNRAWVADTLHVVSQRHTYDPTLRPDDLPDWDLGINVSIPVSGCGIREWHSDVSAIVQFVASLTKKFRREFVIGIYDSQTGLSEDLHYIDFEEFELDKIRILINSSVIK